MNLLSRTTFAALLLGFASAPALANGETLYQRLGGYDAIAAVTDDFLGRLEKDDQLGRFFVGFSDDSLAKVRQHVIDLVCFSTGGPCVYTGRDMATSHKGADISTKDWQRMMVLFGETMKKFDVPEDMQQELGAIVGPLEKDIVTVKG